MQITDEMKWDAIDELIPYLRNNRNNKKRGSAKKEERIEEAMEELIGNLREFMKNESKYEVSHFINNLAFLMRHSEYGVVQNEENIGAQDNGGVYWVDFGMVDGIETAHRHPTLCITTYGNECFMIPMLSGRFPDDKMKEKFGIAYHPIENPDGEKKYRRGLAKEGFEKDCVLVISDAKFLSVNRIGNFLFSIDKDIVHRIEKHLLMVSMPWQWLQLRMYSKRCKSLEPTVDYQKRKIKNLEKEIRDLKWLLKLEMKKS